LPISIDSINLQKFQKVYIGASYNVLQWLKKGEGIATLKLPPQLTWAEITTCLGHYFSLCRSVASVLCVQGNARCSRWPRRFSIKFPLSEVLYSLTYLVEVAVHMPQFKAVQYGSVAPVLILHEICFVLLWSFHFWVNLIIIIISLRPITKIRRSVKTFAFVVYFLCCIMIIVSSINEFKTQKYFIKY
jgi:hypothetical protein